MPAATKFEWKSADVSSLRDAAITSQPIVYRWWFTRSVVPRLLKPLEGEVDLHKISYKDGYALLYVGSGKKGHERLIKYHILDWWKFHETGVANGRLSSLRQTLCGLIGCKMSAAREIVDRFMDQNCRVEWREVPTLEPLLEAEVAEIKSHYLPLNSKHTKGTLTRAHRKLLSRLKREAKS